MLAATPACMSAIRVAYEIPQELKHIISKFHYIVLAIPQTDRATFKYIILVKMLQGRKWDIGR